MDGDKHKNNQNSKNNEKATTGQREQQQPPHDVILTTYGNKENARGGANDDMSEQKSNDSNNNNNNTSNKTSLLSNDPNKQKRNNNNNNSNNNNSTNNASNKPEMKSENESKDSEFIVFVTSLKIPFEKKMIDELRGEESDLLEMAKNQPPNHSGIVAFGKKIGLTGDNLEYYAEKLATKLIKKYGNNQSNDGDTLTRRKFAIRGAAKGFKTRCIAVASLRHLNGEVQLVEDSKYTYFCGVCIARDAGGKESIRLADNEYLRTGALCRQCFTRNKDGTITHLLLEGTKDNIGRAVKELQLSANDEVKCNGNVLEKAMFEIIPTALGIRDVNSSGMKRRAFSHRSDTTTSVQSGFKDALLIRDNRTCRMHGENCPFITLGDDSTFTAGHISSVGKDEQIEQIVKQGLTHDIRNGYLWCHETEFCWTQHLFTINDETGVVEFAPNFPFKDMEIQENARIVLAKWQDESKDNNLDSEPPKWLIKERNKVYIRRRKDKLKEQEEKKLSQDFECKKCGRWFANGAGLTDHQNDRNLERPCSVQDGELLPLMFRHFYIV